MVIRYLLTSRAIFQSSNKLHENLRERFLELICDLLQIVTFLLFCISHLDIFLIIFGKMSIKDQGVERSEQVLIIEER